jgi:hypothetical protein
MAGSTLMELLREELSGDEQEMFVQRFHVYLKHNAKRDFVIDFNDVWAWLGFSNGVGNAIRVLHKNLKEGQHFILLTRAPQGSIMLTPNGFKQFCMAANTEEARRVREYYISMEGVLLEYTRQQIATASLALQVAQLAVESAREAQIKAEADAAASAAELARMRSKIYDEVPKYDTIYIMAEQGSDRHTVVNSTQLNAGIYMRKTSNGKLVEDFVKHALKRYNIGNSGGTEHYHSNTEHTADVIDIVCCVSDTLASTSEFITRLQLFAKIYENLATHGRS